jgi:hypothetical protein
MITTENNEMDKCSQNIIRCLIFSNNRYKLLLIVAMVYMSNYGYYFGRNEFFCSVVIITEWNMIEGLWTWERTLDLLFLISFASIYEVWTGNISGVYFFFRTWNVCFGKVSKAVIAVSRKALTENPSSVPGRSSP